MGTKTVIISGNYQSHYNVRLGKCLMLVERSDMLASQPITAAYVMDANERRQYATYVWMSREGKKYWEVPPMARRPCRRAEGGADTIACLIVTGEPKMHASCVKLFLLWGTVILASGPITHAQSLEQQERCGQQARRAYTEKDAQDRTDMQKMGTGHSRTFGDFQSHYNVKLGKCLMLVETTDMSGSEFIKTAYVTDANERRLYATYVWMSKEGKEYWEVSPMSCDLIVSMLEKRACKTREEFDAFVARYMEE